jgi:predicted ThiF/HesA family dinucleotide-utilizing enzyme
MMTQEEKDGVIWWAIDDALKRASSGFINYESMAREHITEVVNAIKEAIDRNNLEIVEKTKEIPK